MTLYNVLMISILWAVAAVGAFIHTAVTATHKFEVYGKLTKRWWVDSALYLGWALFVCVADTIFLLLYAKLL